ncbi:MAG: F0F1 ATP synthase subunit A [Lachnospiraceae bacterium]|nr:F0F1 ATP synthase subunit A [Lachnospiraceae bacterium]
MNNYPLLLSGGGNVDFMIKGIFSYKFFGHEVWITTTHVCTLIVMLLLIVFAALGGRAARNADIDKAPGKFLNVVELLMDFLDGVINSTMGKNAGKFVNYIMTLFLFIFLSNISGLLGLRPPTADYGVTFPLGVITFSLITFNKFKYQKVSGVIKGLCDPWVFWIPINLIGDFAVPISLSLRLFANVLSGTVMMALYYGLLPIFVKVGIPSVLHIYFDLFSGAIQTYVFCMLTMTYVSDAIGEG